MSLFQSRWLERPYIFLLLAIVLFDFRISLASAFGFCLWRVLSITSPPVAGQNEGKKSYDDTGIQTDSLEHPLNGSVPAPPVDPIVVSHFIDLIRVDGFTFENTRHILEERLRRQSHEQLIRVALDLFAYERPPEPPLPQMPASLYQLSMLEPAKATVPKAARHTSHQAQLSFDSHSRSSAEPIIGSRRAYNQGAVNSYTVTRPAGPVRDVS